MPAQAAVLILNYNGRRFLDECLSAVTNQSYLDYAAYVIDNGSTDGSVGYVRTRFPGVKVIENEENLLFAGGNNVGLLKLARETPYLVLLNNDTKVSYTWLEELVRAARGPDVGIVTSTIEERSKRYCGGSLNLWTGTVAGNPASPPDQAILPVFYASGCSMLIKSAVLDQIGALDDDYGCYFEDVDLCWRAWLAGYRVVCNARSLVEHYGGGTSQGSRDSYRLAERNRLLTYYKNLSPAALAVVFPVMLLCRLFLCIVVLRDGVVLQGVVEGLRRIPCYRGKRAAVQRLRRVPDRRVLASSRPDLRSKVWRLLREARYGDGKGQ